MAKRDYTKTKLAITGAVAGITVLTAGWLAAPAASSTGSVAAASSDASVLGVSTSNGAVTTTAKTSNSTTGMKSTTKSVKKTSRGS